MGASGLGRRWGLWGAGERRVTGLRGSGVHEPARRCRSGRLVAWATVVGVLLAVVGTRGAVAAPASVSAPVPEPRLNWAGVLEAAAQRQDPEGRLLRAAAYINLGRIVDAFREVDQLARLEYRSLAQVLIGKYEAAYRANPRDLVALNCLAFGYYAVDELDEAIHTLRALATADPDNPWPRNLMAMAYFSAGKLDEAKGAATEALDIAPGNEYAHLILSAVYYSRHDYLRFLSHYLQAPHAARELQGFLADQG